MWTFFLFFYLLNKKDFISNQKDYIVKHIPIMRAAKMIRDHGSFFWLLIRDHGMNIQDYPTM